MSDTEKDMDEKKRDIDYWRKGWLSLAEAIDAFRIIPRLVLAGYAYIMLYITMWYLDLEPYMLEGCDVAVLAERCIVDAPTTTHTTIITAVTGFATGLFGFYVNSGRDWREGVKMWSGPSDKWETSSNWKSKKIDDENQPSSPS